MILEGADDILGHRGRSVSSAFALVAFRLLAKRQLKIEIGPEAVFLPA